MKILAVLLGAVLLTACNESNRTDVTYDRRDVNNEKRSIDASVEEQKKQIDANARFEKERLEAEAEKQKKIMEAEREKAAALDRAADRRADKIENINEPAGVDLGVRRDLDEDEVELRSSLKLQDNRDVTLRLDDGVLTLKGVVDTEAQKVDLEARAKGLGGVKRVDNQLRVR